MDNTPKIILTSDRLILRTWKASDAPLMTVVSSDPLAMEHFPSSQDLAATQTLINNINHHYEKFGYSLYTVETKDTHEFIGFVGLNHPSTELKLSEIISFAVAANTKSRRVMEKIGLHHSEVDDFDHPKLEKDSPLSRHALHCLSREKMIQH